MVRAEAAKSLGLVGDAAAPAAAPLGETLSSPDVAVPNSDYAVLRWKCPADNPAIELYRANRGDHHWFTADNSGVAATDVIWEFFRAHPKS